MGVAAKRPRWVDKGVSSREVVVARAGDASVAPYTVGRRGEACLARLASRGVHATFASPTEWRYGV